MRAAIRWNLTCEGGWGPSTVRGGTSFLDVRIMAFRRPICQVGSGRGRHGRVKKSPKCLGLSPGARRSFASLRMTNLLGLDDRVVEKAGRTNASAPTWFVVIIAASSL